MNSWKPQFDRVSQDRPCPVCGKPDWCLIARDGSAAICPRTEAGATKYISESGWLHRLQARTIDPRPQPRKSPPQRTTKSLSAEDLREALSRFERHAEIGRVELAEQLGLHAEVLSRLNVGYCKYEKCWSFPERGARGDVIGLQKRYRNNAKYRLAGSKSGLTYADDWDTGAGPLLLVEGASDVAAAMMLGLSVIGRPSNRGGVAFLGEMLASFDEHRGIIVMGERDQKESGLWPGKDGAIHTSRELSKRLMRPLHWALPPDNAKDVRAWLNQYGQRNSPPMGELFLKGLALQQVDPPPIRRARMSTAPVLAADEYRSQMLKKRLQSLDRPGCYVDRSTTGHGKSQVDLEVIKSMLVNPEVN